MIKMFSYGGICICVFGNFVSVYFCIFVRDSYLYFSVFVIIIIFLDALASLRPILFSE